MTGVQSQERSQQEAVQVLGRIEELLRQQVGASTLDEEFVTRKLHCGQYMSRNDEGYIQTCDGTQWEFRKSDVISIEGHCLLIQTSGHDGRGNAGHANIMLPLSRIVAIVIT